MRRRQNVDKKVVLLTPRLLSFALSSRMLLLVFFCLAHYYASFHENLVRYTAVFRVVTQRSPPPPSRVAWRHKKRLCTRLTKTQRIVKYRKVKYRWFLLNFLVKASWFIWHSSLAWWIESSSFGLGLKDLLPPAQVKCSSGLQPLQLMTSQVTWFHMGSCQQLRVNVLNTWFILQ